MGCRRHVPVWYEQTAALRDSHQLQFVGLIQEQHPQRCELFMQWKQMQFPVLVDPLNLLEVQAVPIAVLIDRGGVVRSVLRDPRRDVQKLVGPLERAPEDEPPHTVPAVRKRRRILDHVRDQLYFASPPRYEKALNLLERNLPRRHEPDGESESDEAGPINPAYAPLYFARGVVYRARYDSPERRPGDFQAAVDAWQQALALNPNQYIWRRRIQQYGPRLEKPYAFYDWVPEARRAIRDRGETPVKLEAEPTGAELARPLKSLPADMAATPKAAPEHERITRDRQPLIRSEITRIPRRVEPGKSVRIHMRFHPDSEAGGHWNNEAEPLRVFIDPPDGWTAHPRVATAENADQAISNESRTVEFELRAPADAGSGKVRVPAYALYNVCEGDSALCLFRRQDLDVTLVLE